MKRFLFALSLIAILLSACGPEPEPTLSPEQVQGTAEAAAWTIVAETQAAIPTATLIPPTDTPAPTVVPTNTTAALLLPTQTPLFTATPEKDECDRLLPADPDGPDFPLKIINEVKAPVTISIYLEKTPFGVCGYRAYQLTSKGETLVRFPQGVMWGYAWINDPKTPTTASGGPWRPNNNDKWTIHIYATQLKMIGP